MELNRKCTTVRVPEEKFWLGRSTKNGWVLYNYFQRIAVFFYNNENGRIWDLKVKLKS